MKKLVLPLILVLAACTSAPELQKYPRTEINRPYTLPEHVAAWITPIPFGIFSDGSRTITIPPIPIPLFWKVGLSDTWTLNFSPLPLGLSHQLYQSDTQLLGVSFGTGGGYSSGSGVVFAPYGSLLWRQLLTPTLALEVSPSVNFRLPTRAAAQWSAGVSAGPLVQLSETFAARVKAALSLEENYSPSFTEVGIVNTTTSPTPELTLALSASFTWSIHRQWDFDASYTYLGIGQGPLDAHVGMLQFAHYW